MRCAETSLIQADEKEQLLIDTPQKDEETPIEDHKEEVEDGNLELYEGYVEISIACVLLVAIGILLLVNIAGTIVETFERSGSERYQQVAFVRLAK